MLSETQLLIAPGNPARSNGNSNAAISVGSPDDDQAVADRMGEARQGLRKLPLRQGHGHDEKAPALRESFVEQVPLLSFRADRRPTRTSSRAVRKAARMCNRSFGGDSVRVKRGNSPKSLAVGQICAHRSLSGLLRHLGEGQAF